MESSGKECAGIALVSAMRWKKAKLISHCPNITKQKRRLPLHSCRRWCFCTEAIFDEAFSLARPRPWKKVCNNRYSRARCFWPSCEPMANFSCSNCPSTKQLANQRTIKRCLCTTSCYWHHQPVQQWNCSLFVKLYSLQKLIAFGNAETWQQFIQPCKKSEGWAQRIF